MDISTDQSSVIPEENNTTNNNGSLNTTNRKRKLTDDFSNVNSTISPVWSQGGLMVEDISVPTEIVGLLIGKAGAAHQRLQLISGARIYIAPDPPSNTKIVQHQRLVTITGTLDAVNQAKSFIQEAQHSGIIPFQLDPDFVPGNVCEDLLIPKDKVGLVIGKKGEKIKRLQEDCGCKMFLFMDGIHKTAPEKTLRITGSIDKVSYGKTLVEELLINSNMERKEKMLVVSARLAKRLIGKKGASVKMIQKQSDAYMHIIEDPDHSSDYRTFRLNGTDLMIQKAVAIMQDLTKDYSISVKDPPDDWPKWADDQVKQLRQKQQLKQQENSNNM